MKLRPAKKKSQFFCQSCGAITPKWTGKCMTCGTWSSLVEEPVQTPQTRQRGLGGSGKVTLLKDVDCDGNVRLHTGMGELDRVLGGGIISGSLVLVGGDPGIGKSTLLLQMTATLSAADVACLYVSGEESLTQIKVRARRLNIPSPNLPIFSETNLTAVLEAAEKVRPKILVLDSIQTVYNPDLPGSPGSETQLKEAAHRLMVFAKTLNCTVFLVGHVTKGGQIAGPKMIEHMVDTVVYFESEKQSLFRVLRAVKNRFGATNEIGVFEMTAVGLTPVTNASAFFVHRSGERDPGSIITCSMEGTRPVLLEIQALVNPSAFSNPQRVAMGFDSRRLTILLALLEKFGGIEICGQDVFISVAGGFRIDDPAADIAVASAVASNHLNKKCLPGALALGELGLNGEVRSVSFLAQRIKEGVRMGFKRIIIPQAAKKPAVKGAELVPVRRLQQALDEILS
jgi:DNA repair protein RadA/Sms